MNPSTVQHALSAEAIISLCALFSSLAGLIFVYVQLKLFTRQLKLESRIQMSAINREILTLGFNDPDLFEILRGKRTSLEKERRFLQLWLNQVDIIWHARKYGMLEDEEWIAWQKDIGDLLELESMQEHWRNSRLYYAPKFRFFIDSLYKPTKPVRVLPP